MRIPLNGPAAGSGITKKRISPIVHGWKRVGETRKGIEAVGYVLCTGGHLVTGLRPGFDSAIHEHRMVVPFADIVRCLTDSGTVIGSSAIKDDLLVFR